MTKKRTSKRSSKSARSATREARPTLSQCISVATDGDQPVQARVAAIAQLPTAISSQDDSNAASMLKVLRDQNEPVKVRLAALQALQAAAFSVVAFEPYRADYVAALRDVADDPDPELRQRVLGILARDKDGFAQKKLLEGLRNPAKALVPPEKALQLLSYDVHAEAYPVARAIVNNPPNDLARREALRLLAADATAAPLFTKILRDKKESSEIRRISASALHSLQPSKLQQQARELLLDSSESDEMHATSLTAITQFGDTKAVAGDQALLRRVNSLSGKASPKIKQGARRFLTKYGQ